jgi:hypothetical protein
MKNLLRLYIREALRRLVEKDVISEPDERDEEKQDEMSTLGGTTGGVIRGSTSALGTGPTHPDKPGSKKKKKKKPDVNARAFGGGEYSE